MNQTIFVLHSVFVMVKPLQELFSEILPQAKVFNLVDDSLLPEVIREGKVTKKIMKRVCGYITTAEEIGANAVLSVCTTMTDAVDIAKSLVNIPLLKIDEPMVEKALALGEKIGLVATFPPTLDPSGRFILKKAEELKKKIVLKKVLCPGAFDAVLCGDQEKHDAIVAAEVKKIQKEVDVIILAQGSMAKLEPKLSREISIPILTSPRLAVQRIKELLGKAQQP
jgi:Asp/Glu/hydantoin racemase